MRQDFADLGVPAAAIDPLHQVAELARVGNPARGAAFGQSAVIDQLHIESADRGGFAKHVGLQPAGRVPQRLAAHGGVERKNQPPALSGLRRRSERAHLVEKSVDLLRARSLALARLRPFGRRWGAVFCSSRLLRAS